MERPTPSQKRKATAIDSTPPIDTDKKIRRLSLIGFVPLPVHEAAKARDANEGDDKTLSCVTPPHIELTEARVARLVMAPYPSRPRPTRGADHPIPRLMWTLSEDDVD